MNFAGFTIYLYFLKIFMGVGLAAPHPINNRKYESSVQEVQQFGLSQTRFPRQVVQPKWLNIDWDPPTDSKVHINQQALSEAAKIRRIIQKAKKENNNVQFNKKKAPKSSVNHANTVPPLHDSVINDPIHVLSNWCTNMQTLKKRVAETFLKIFA